MSIRRMLEIGLKSFKKNIRYVVISLMTIYLVIYLYITLFSRKPADTNQYILIPFWSYIRVLSFDGGLMGSFLSLFGFEVRPLTLDNAILIKQITLNILLYIPFGALNYVLLRSSKKQRIILVIYNAIILSSLTEIVQLLSRRGLFEFDDIFSNVIGCVMGYVLTKGLKTLIAKSISSRGEF